VNHGGGATPPPPACLEALQRALSSLVAGQRAMSCSVVVSPAFNGLLVHIVDIWHLVLISFEVSWVTLGNVPQLLHCWKFLGHGHPREAIWKAIPALLMWGIWREKNRRIFEDSESSVLLLKSSFLRFLLNWALAHVPTFSSGNLVNLICFLDCNNT
jgi:hypothetical protein